MRKERTLKQVSENDFLTVEEAADTLGIKPNAVRNYLNLGKFTTHKFKTLTLISANEVESWRERQK